MESKGAAMSMESQGTRTPLRLAASIMMLCALAAACGPAAGDSFYAIAETPASPKLIRIDARAVNSVTITRIGATGVVGCAAIARSPKGTLYSVCGQGLAKPGPQQLAAVDPNTGHATTIGQTIDGLQIMGMTFGPDGKLYAVGDANPASPTFNSLYTIDVATAIVTRVGSTGASSFFHDFALDRQGIMYGSAGDALYTIDLKTGTATKVADFVGGGQVMGLSFNADQTKLYATDWKQPISDVYLVDLHTGFLTALGATGYPLAHGLTR
jgi:DNA-binding beta-propeller fold protein YncE